MGSYHGHESFKTFTHAKACLVRRCFPEVDAALRYPPYSLLGQRVLRVLLSPALSHAWQAGMNALTGDNLLIAALMLYVTRLKIRDCPAAALRAWLGFLLACFVKRYAARVLD